MLADSGLSGLSGMIPGTLWTPASVPGLQLWLDGLTGVYTDAGTTTPAINDGDLVQRWVDQSANANYAQQTTGANRPVLKIITGTDGGVYQCLRFNGTSDTMLLNATIAIGTSPIAVYAALRYGAPATETVLGGNANSFTLRGNTQQQIVLTGVAVKLTGNLTYSTADSLVVAAKYDGSSSAFLRINAANDNSAAIGAVNWSDPLRYLGSVLATPAQFLNGDLIALLVYTAIPSAGDEALIEQYLARRAWANNYIAFDGNSLTATSQDGGNSYPTQCLTLLGAPALGSLWGGQNFGVSGQTTADMNSDAATQIDVRYRSLRPKNFSVAWEVTNDVKLNDNQASALSNIQTYCTNRKTKGFTTLLLSVLPRQDSGLPADFETIRTNINAQFRSDFNVSVPGYPRLFKPGAGGTYADLLVDVAANTNLQDPTNTTYFQTDKVHLHDAGYALVASDVRDGLLQF
jgi:hypothetical protein